MKQKRKSQVRDKQGKKSKHLVPPRRKSPQEWTVAKRFTMIPKDAVDEIREASKTHGSVSRTLQVATEMLIRMRKRPLVPPEGEVTLTNMTYRLVPRTVEVIEELKAVYGDKKRVFAACAAVLKLKDL